MEAKVDVLKLTARLRTAGPGAGVSDEEWSALLSAATEVVEAVQDYLVTRGYVGTVPVGPGGHGPLHGVQDGLGVSLEVDPVSAQVHARARVEMSSATEVLTSGDFEDNRKPWEPTLTKIEPILERRLRELHKLRAVVQKVTEAVAAAGFVYEADGRAPHSPRPEELAGCVEAKAKAIRALEAHADSLEAALYALEHDVEDGGEFWGAGKTKPAWWMRLPGLAYHLAAQGGRISATLAWKKGGPWLLTREPRGDLEPLSILADHDVPWHDPPFEWAERIVGMEKAGRPGV